MNFNLFLKIEFVHVFALNIATLKIFLCIFIFYLDWNHFELESLENLSEVYTRGPLKKLELSS